MTPAKPLRRFLLPLLAALVQSVSVAAQTNRSALSPASPLPGDLGIFAAAAKQEKPHIAKGGETSLVVWADTRTALAGNGTISVGGAGPYFGRGLGTMNDIYAARLDQNGNVIDQHPIVIWQGSYNQTRPQAAWNGENWLVVWYQELENDYYNYEIRAVRVSPAGVVLDATPMSIGSANNNLGDWPVRVLFNGTNWVVFWYGFAPSATTRSVRAARVAANGTVLDPQGVTVYSHPDQYVSDPSVAYNGSGYLLVFRHLVDDKVYGLLVSQALSPLGGIFPINNYSPSEPTHPRVEALGANYLVVWNDHPFSGNIGGVKGSRVASNGQVLDPSGLTIDANVGTSESFPVVTSSGGTWHVAYVSGYDAPNDTYGGQRVKLRRVSGAGSVMDSNAITVSGPDGHSLFPAIAPGFTNTTQVVWHDWRADQDIYTAGLSAEGVATSEQPVSLGAPRQSRPRMAHGANVFLAVFQRETAGDAQIFAQRLNQSGAAIDPEPLLLSSDATNPTNANPSVAFNGTNFFVVWDRQEQDVYGNIFRKVYGRRIAPNGTPVDATQFFVMDGLTPDVAALGDTFLTVAIRPVGQQVRNVESVRVSGAGVILGSQSLLLGNFNHAPRVAAFRERWLVVWEYHSRHDASTSWIRGSFVDAGGVATSSFQVSVSDSPFGTGNSYDDTPHLAVAGNEALVVWADNDTNQNNIKGRRIAPDGTLLGSNYGFLICDAPGSQFIPAVAWDGTSYIATWLDQRGEQYPVQPRGNIYATRVTPAEVVDTSGFAVANTVQPEETPFVVSGDGRSIFAWSAFYPHAPLSAMRITTRSTSAPVTDGLIVVSRKTHAGTWTGDVNLPLTGDPGVEPRNPGAAGHYQIVATFSAPVTVAQAQVTSGVGAVSGMSVAGSQVTIDLTGVANAQRLTVTLSGVNNETDVAIPMAILVGDTNGDGVVNSGDAIQTRNRSGQDVYTANCRSDVNADGAINSGDSSIIRRASGTSLP